MTQQVIREAIQQVLREHVKEPFMLLREVGLQASLWSNLRQTLSPAVVCSQIRPKSRNSRHQHTRDFETSRVQLELKVGGKRRKSDIVVFRADRKPRLTCWPAGPTDVVAAIKPDDVEAVIEMKAAPSQANELRARIDDDLQKLSELRAEHPQIQCYFVLIDKSVSVPGASCDPSLAQDLPLDPARKLRESPENTGGNLIEVWDLDCGSPPRPRLRYTE